MIYIIKQYNHVFINIIAKGQYSDFFALLNLMW